MKRSAAAVLAAGVMTLVLSACQPEDEAQSDDLRRGGSSSGSSQASSATASASVSSSSRTTTKKANAQGDPAARATTCADYKGKSPAERKSVVAKASGKVEEDVSFDVLFVTVECSMSGDKTIGEILDDRPATR